MPEKGICGFLNLKYFGVLFFLFVCCSPPKIIKNIFDLQLFRSLSVSESFNKSKMFIGVPVKYL